MDDYNAVKSREVKLVSHSSPRITIVELAVHNDQAVRITVEQLKSAWLTFIVKRFFKEPAKQGCIRRNRVHPPLTPDLADGARGEPALISRTGQLPQLGNLKCPSLSFHFGPIVREFVCVGPLPLD
jgi:hypothetical protein